MLAGYERLGIRTLLAIVFHKAAIEGHVRAASRCLADRCGVEPVELRLAHVTHANRVEHGAPAHADFVHHDRANAAVEIMLGPSSVLTAAGGVLGLFTAKIKVFSVYARN